MITEIFKTLVYANGELIDIDKTIISIPNYSKFQKEVLNELARFIKREYADKYKIHRSKLNVYFYNNEIESL